MDLEEFKEILSTAVEELYHFEAGADAGEEYAVWQETGSRSLYSSGVRCGTVLKLQVDLYTGKENTETLGKILDVLEENDIAFMDPIPGFDPDTKKLRYIIECEAV